MGGEALGARTHGGHVPPPGATGLADGSTGSGSAPIPSSDGYRAQAWIGREVSADAG